MDQSLLTSAPTIQRHALLVAALILATAGNALADVRYVDVNSTNATPPYISWATAATNIQDAVDAAVGGDEIVVTNGLYTVGGRSTIDQNTTTNRVVVDKPLTVRSVNGPQSTIIDGGGVFRCVYLTNGASLFGFTLTNGRAHSGGGLWCESTNAVISNCVVSGNSSFGGGTYRGVGAPCCDGGYRTERTAFAGGVYGGTVNNCILNGNWAANYATPGRSCDLSTCSIVSRFCSSSPCGDQFPGQGGGAANAILNNCTLTGNSAYFGGGAFGCTLNNCTLNGNSAISGYGGHGGGASGCTLNNCTLTDNSAIYGGGAYGCALNNCTLTGNHADAVLISDDEGGIYRIGGYGGGAYGSTVNNCIVYFNTAPDGANFYHSSSILNYSCTTPLPTNGVGNITNAPLFVDLAAGNYRLRPDSPCIDAGTNLSASITNDLDGRPRPLDGNGDGLAAFDMGAYEYRTPLLVWQDSPNPTRPHADWATAAHTIQDAVDAAVAGDEIVVTNGVYSPVVVDKPLSLLSINGPQFTTINGHNSVRCVSLTSNASLSGFALIYGLGSNRGGGVYGGTLNNCWLSGNSCYRGTAQYPAPQSYGGGAYGSTLNNCTLSGNSASHGGGAAGCTLNNCTLTGNRAFGAFDLSNGPGRGAGADYSTLNNCTIVGNGASANNYGGGVSGSTLYNCIIYSNNAAFGENHYSSTLNYSCTTPQPFDGLGNITNAPLFVDQAGGNLRLQSNSPCINAGLNLFAPAGPDLDGNPRIVGGTVDIGAYEYQSLDLLGFGIVSNRFGFNVTGQSNWVIVLEASRDFTYWTPLTTNTLGGSPFPFRDSTPRNLPQRFYRARQW